MQFLGIKALKAVLQDQFDCSHITREREGWRDIMWEAVLYRKWITMLGREKMYLLPVVYYIKWAAGDMKGQDASFTNLRSGFLPRTKVKISSTQGPSRTTHLADRRQEIHKYLHSTSSHRHLCSVAPCRLCRDLWLSSKLLSRPYSLPCEYWQLVTLSFVTGMGKNKEYKEKTTRAHVGWGLK